MGKGIEHIDYTNMAQGKAYLQGDIKAFVPEFA